MEVLLDSGINFIIHLQKSWAGWQNEMLFLSKVGDPRNSFLIYFPVVYHLNHNLGVSVLWTAILSEWINLVLKWILRGDRPYWWIHETAQWKNVTLQQFELTCETGPGSPSGHSMVTSAVLCLVFLWLMNSLKETLCQAHFLIRFIITATIWSILLTILSLVSLSRVFIATHFPHQVILGTIIGLFVAFTVRRNSSELFKFSHSVLHCATCSIMLVISTLASHFILSVLIYDPSISVSKAQKWCVDPTYVHLDTTPFYALVRDSGATLGLGIAFLIVRSVTGAGMNHWRALSNVQFPLLSKSLRIILSVFLLQLLEAISLPKSNPLLFYVAGYGRCAFIPIIIIFVVPMIVSS